MAEPSIEHQLQPSEYVELAEGPASPASPSSVAMSEIAEDPQTTTATAEAEGPPAASQEGDSKHRGGRASSDLEIKEAVSQESTAVLAAKAQSGLSPRRSIVVPQQTANSVQSMRAIGDLPSSLRSPSPPSGPSDQKAPIGVTTPDTDLANFERFRRSTVAYRERMVIDAFKVLKAGSEMAVKRSGDSPKVFVSVRLAESADKLVLAAPEGSGDPPTEVAVCDIHEVTRWLSNRDRDELGPAARAAFMLTFGPQLSPSERAEGMAPEKVILFAKDENTLSIWSTGLAKLAGYISHGKATVDLASLKDLPIDIPVKEEPASFVAVIEQNVFKSSEPSAPAAPPKIPVPLRLSSAPPTFQVDPRILSPTSVASAPSPLAGDLAGPPPLLPRAKSFHVIGAPNDPIGELQCLDVLPYMKKGQDFFKFGRSGAPHFRRFYVSNDNKYFCWDSPYKFLSKTQVPWEKVTQLRFGLTTEVFEKNSPPLELSEAAFSLVYEDDSKTLRTLDLIAMSSNVLNVWSEGLQALITMAKSQPSNLSTLKELLVDVYIQDKPTKYAKIVDRIYKSQ